MHASPSNNLLNSHPLHPETLLDSWNPQDTMQSAATSGFENPPHDVLSSTSIICTSASEIGRNPESIRNRQIRPLVATRSSLVRMDDVLDRLFDPPCLRGSGGVGICHPNPYRPSLVPNGVPRRGDLTATWCGELRVQNEALVDENAFAKEQTLRDLERLTASGTRMSSGIRGSYNSQQSSYVVSCSADMREYASEADDLRADSFLRERPRIPMRRMQVPGMGPEFASFDSSNDDSFLGMELATIDDFTMVEARRPPSVCSSVDTSASKPKFSSLRHSRMARCVKGLNRWRKFPRTTHGQQTTPAIREDTHYDYANDSLSLAGSTRIKGANCFTCLGGTKYSIDEPDIEIPVEVEEPSSTSKEFKSVLLTTSPLYGDVNATPRTAIDEPLYSTQNSLNIAATHIPTSVPLADSDEESDGIDEANIIDIWENESEPESDTDSAINSDAPYSRKHWDYGIASSWEPPTLKTDQEYEMYQLQSRIKAEHVVRTKMLSRQKSPPPHRFTPEELVDTASSSSWDLKGSIDFSTRGRNISQGSSWSDAGFEAVRSELNNLHTS